MTKVSSTCCHAIFALAALMQAASVSAQEGGAEPTTGSAEKPFAFVQILNGISPHKVSLSINGQALYKGIAAGTRISSFGVPRQEWTLDVSKDGSDAVKDFTLKLPREGFYTVVLTGDFAELPPVVGPNGTRKPDYRVKASFLSNKKPDGQTVDVRIVNGATKGDIQLLRDKREQCSAAPGETGVAENQPAGLFMEALWNGSTIPLYIAQEPPGANITIVFYESAGTLRFRAMTEKASADPVP